MSVKHINTFGRIQQNTKLQMSVVSKEMSTGRKVSFEKSADIIIGGIHQINHLMYKAAGSGVNSVISLLNQSQHSLNEMSNVVHELHRMCVYAGAQNLPQSELNVLETIFQTQIQNLDQIATTAKYGDIHLLDGSMDDGTPLQINTPDGDIIDITIPNMTNAASPINNPDPDAPHIRTPCTAQEFRDAVGPANGGTTLGNISTFVGEDSFLYIVANQINEAFTTGVYATCLAQLEALPWDTLLRPSEAADARALIATPAFSDPGGTLETCITLGFTVYDVLDQAISAPYVPANYVAQKSDGLSIASPDNLYAVVERLKLTTNYITDAQSKVNNQIRYMEGVRVRYYEHADQSGENTAKYFETDVMAASSKLNRLIASQDLAISATVGFRAQLNAEIAYTAQRILQQRG